jgi:hypothetical protein
MRRVSPLYLSYIRKAQGPGRGGYSTGAEMALEMLQASKGSTAIFTRQGLSVSSTLLFLGFLVLHLWGLGDWR